MPNAKPAARSNAKGLGCLAVALLFIVAGCNALFGADDTTTPAAYTPPPIPSYTPWTPEKWTPEPAPDLDDDGIADVYDDDEDGDGVNVLRDIDDRDPGKGKRPQRKKTHKPRPRPEPEPVQVGNVHPGGFCGTPGAVGTSRGRTYVCRGGHWRR